jgi:hypothetical protein
MLATLLLIRCDDAVILDFCALWLLSKVKLVQHDWVAAEFHVNFSDTRLTCERVVDEARQRQQLLQEVEARTFFARFVAFKRGAATASS